MHVVPGDAGADALVVLTVADGVAPAVRPVQKRPGRPIEITLRSTPPGAQVAVDGVPYGETPQVWSGETGAEHEFTFTLARHEMARYRFVPVATGVLHARLAPLAEETDAGVAAPPEVVPRRPPAPAMVQPAFEIDAPVPPPPIDAAPLGQAVPN